MTNEYFVLYKRDRSGETMERCKGRLMYDKLKEFGNESTAIEFALSHLQDTPILAKTVKALTDYQTGTDYIIATYFEHKYQHHSYDGSSNSVPTHEAVKCNQEHLDAVVQELANESPSKMYLGIERKLIPTALDVIKSVNQHEN